MAASRTSTIAALVDRTLTREEFDAWVNAPMSSQEADEIRGLVIWFTRRYPTPAERLASNRQSIRDAERLAAAGRVAPPIKQSSA